MQQTTVVQVNHLRLLGRVIELEKAHAERGFIGVYEEIEDCGWHPYRREKGLLTRLI